MRGTRHAPLALMLVAALGACSESDTSTPIAPSAPVVAPIALPNGPTGPGTGTIVIRELSPAPGTKLAVMSASFNGFFVYCVTNADLKLPGCSEDAITSSRCNSKNSRWTLTRR